MCNEEFRISPCSYGLRATRRATRRVLRDEFTSKINEFPYLGLCVYRCGPA
jgi:hypothetical protein